MEADEIPNRCIQDPRFIKLLAASLCSDIAESKIILSEINTEIGELKENFSKECQRRKLVKRSILQLDKNKQLLTNTLESLDRDTQRQSIEIEAAKNYLDDGSLRRIHECLELKRILENYHDTWQKYKGEYEKRRLAIERQRCRINVQRVDVQRMIIEYKNVELMKMLKKRDDIDATRMKTLLVDFSEMMLHRRKKDKYYELLKSTNEEMENELAVCAQQLSDMHQREMERQAISEDGDTTFKMPLLRLQFPLELLEHHQTAMKNQDDASHDDLDTLSINTLVLDELCDKISNDSTSTLKDISFIEKSLESLVDRNIVRDESLDNIPPPSSFSSAPLTPHLAANIFEESDVRDTFEALPIIDNANQPPPSSHHSEEKLSSMYEENLNETKERNMEIDSHNQLSYCYRNASNHNTSPIGKTMTPRGTAITDEPEINRTTIDEKSREENNLSRNIIEDPCELPPVLGQDQNRSSSIYNASIELANSLQDAGSTEILKKNHGDFKILNDDECSSPKIRKIAASIDQDSPPSSMIRMEQSVTEIEAKRVTDVTSPLLSPVDKYSPSCTSPQQDTPLDKLPTNRNFPCLSNLGIWSPPQPQPRQIESFSSSSSNIDHFTKSNNDARINQPPTSDDPAIDLQEFFKKTGKNSRTMF